HGLVDLPLAGIAERLVEQVLPILDVDHRVAAIAICVGWRQIHIELAPIAQLGAIDIVKHSNVADDGVAEGVLGVRTPGIRYVHISVWRSTRLFQKHVIQRNYTMTHPFCLLTRCLQSMSGL